MTYTPDLKWEDVPQRVAHLLPRALFLKEAHLQAAAESHLLVNTFVTWVPASNTLAIYAVREPVKSAAEKYRHIMGVQPVEFRSIAQPNWDEEVLIKSAALPGVAPAFDFANRALGATPLSNAIVSGLMAGGVGYGTGALLENLFPERYLERGKLRRTLGLVGAGAGVGLGFNNALANSRRMNTSIWKGWVTPNDAAGAYTPKTKAAEARIKEAFTPLQGSGIMLADPALNEPTISVPQFNNAIWSDTRRGMTHGFNQHTPPAYAAAASGMMTGLSTGLQSPIIRPSDVIRGIASAGVGLATANLAGRTLSAMAGLTPEAQNKLQDMGLWGGMMHAIVPSMLGMR